MATSESLLLSAVRWDFRWRGSAIRRTVSSAASIRPTFTSIRLPRREGQSHLKERMGAGMDPETQDILEKVIGYGILALLVIGVGWKL